MDNMDNSQINKCLYEKLKKAISGLQLEEQSEEIVIQPHFNVEPLPDQPMSDDPDNQIFPYDLDEYSDEEVMLNSQDLDNFELLTLADVTGTEKGSQACSICFLTYQQFPDEPIRNLPCEHIFHKSCVDKWLKEKPKCPKCKFDLRDAL